MTTVNILAERKIELIILSYLCFGITIGHAITTIRRIIKSENESVNGLISDGI